MQMVGDDESGPAAPASLAGYRLRPPGLPRAAVRRPRLDTLLAGHLADHQGVVVIAAAGSGKTVQAQLFARSWDLPTAWLTLERRSNSAVRLLAELARAVEAWSASAVDSVERFLRNGYGPEDVASLLAGSLVGEGLLVVDECDALTLPEEPDAGGTAGLLTTFVEHLTPGIQVLLLGRHEPPVSLVHLVHEGRLARVSDADLRLTPDEAATVLAQRGHDVAVERALEVTGGWMVGVAFWPGEGASAPGTPDLTSYLCAELLDRLPALEQRFLLDTSILEVVTPRAAAAVCDYDTSGVVRSIAVRHLPATVATDGSVTYNPVFRSFLRGQLQGRDLGRATVVTKAYACYLQGSGQHDEETELHLSLGDLDAAVASAELALDGVYERADWPQLLRWVAAIGAERVRTSPRLLAAHIRALHGTRRFDQTRRLIREGERLGWLRAATEADPGLVATMAWTLQDQPAEARRLLDTYRGDYRVDAARYMIDACVGDDPAVPPRGAGWADLERLVSWGLLVQGRLSELLERSDLDGDGPIVDTVGMLALASMGDLEGAWRLWERVPDLVRERAQTHFVKGWLLLAEGDLSASLRSAEAALTESRVSGFGLYPLYVVFCARVLVQLGRMSEARAVIDGVLPTIEAEGKRFLVEWSQVLIGFSQLAEGDLEPARVTLSGAIASMERSGRCLFLPMAYTYLAEVEARLGDGGAAEVHRKEARRVVEATGAAHWLERARLDLGVRTRQDRPAACGRESVVPSGARPAPAVLRGPVTVVVQTYGSQPDLLVNGSPLRVGRLKVIELVAYLALHPDGVDRRELQSRLFPEVDWRRGGNHFRQIAHKLHAFTGLRLERGSRGEVRWPADALLDCTDVRFERLVAEARATRGAARREGFQAALELVSGDFLERSDLPWVDERRYHLDVIREEVLLEILAMTATDGDGARTRDLAEELLRINPVCADAYRSLFRLERLSGSDASALAVYRRAAKAFQDLGMRPEEVRDLLTNEKLLLSTGPG